MEINKKELEQKYIKKFLKIYDSFGYGELEEYSFEFEIMIGNLLNELGFKKLAKTINDKE